MANPKEEGVSTPAPKPKPPKRPVRPVPPQPPNHTPLPSAPHTVAAQEVAPHSAHVVPMPAPSSFSVASSLVGPGPAKPPKPVPSYLARHPLIAREIRDARGYMDEFDFNNFMNDKLEEYYSNQNQALRYKLAKKQQGIKDYYTTAQIAQKAGDLNYTEDNPINPRLLNFPDPQGQGSPAALRQEMFDRLEGLDPRSQEAAAIRLLYQGDTYSKGLLDLAAPDNPYSRQNILKYHQDQLKKIAGYQANDLEKSTSYVEATNKKYADHPEYQITDPTPYGNQFDLLQAIGAKGPQTRFEKQTQAKRLAKLLKQGKKAEAQRLLAQYDANAAKYTDTPLGPVIGGDNLQNASAVDAGGNPIGGDPRQNAAFYDRYGHTDTGDKSSFHKYIENPTGQGLLAIVDKISRPLYGVNSALSFAYSQDTDPKHATHNTLLGLMTGNDLPDLNLASLTGSAKAGAKGFYQQGLLNNAADPKFFGEIIAENAKRDPEANIYDHAWFQNTMGFVGDVAFDPTSYITFGAVSGTAKTGSRLALGSRKAALKAEDAYMSTAPGFAKSVDDFMDATGIAHLPDARMAADIINGKVPRPRTPHEAQAHVNAVRTAVEQLGDLGHQQLIARQTHGKGTHQALTHTAAEYAARKEAVLADAGMSEVRDQLENFVIEEVQAGRLGQDALERYDTDNMLDSMHVAKAMPQLDKHFRYWNKVAAQMDDMYSKLDRAGFPVANRPSLMGKSGKGSYARIEKHHEGLLTRARNEPDNVRAQEDLVDFQTKMHEAKQVLEQQGTSDPGTHLNKILGDRIFSDPRLKRMDIVDAANWARGFAWSDPKLGEVRGAIDGIRMALKNQYSTLRTAKSTGNKSLENRVQYSIDKANQQIESYQRSIHAAQSSHFVNSIKKTIAKTGEQSLRETDRSFQLNRMLEEAKRRLKKITGHKNPADLSESKLVRDNRVGSRLDTEAGTEALPTEFLNEEGKWVEDAFEKPDSVYDDEQWLNHMIDTLTKQRDAERASYWDTVTESVDLSNPPPVLMKDGKLDRPKLKDYLVRDDYTGVWTRKGSLGDDVSDEWLDQVAQNATFEHSSIRHKIKHAKEQEVVNRVADQAKIDFNDKLRRNVQDIAPMFAHRDGKLLTDEESLSTVVDGKTQLYPYVLDPETRKPLVLGTVKANDRLLKLHPISTAKRPEGSLTRFEKNQVDDIIREGRAGRLDEENITDEGWDTLRSLKPGVDDDDLLEELIALPKSEFENLLDAKPLHDIRNPDKYIKTVGEQMFKREHGMTLAEAEELRDIALMRNVTGTAAWAEEYGDKVTRKYFIREALKDFESFHNIMRGAPLKFFASASIKSEKEARTVTRHGAQKILSPESKEGIVRSTAWAKQAWKVLQDLPEGEAERRLDTIYTNTRKKASGSIAGRRKEYIQNKIDDARHAGLMDPNKATTMKTSQQAFDETLDYLDRGIVTRSLSNQGFHSRVELRGEPNLGSSDKELFSHAKKHMQADKYASLKQLRKQAKTASRENVRAINQQIREVESDIKYINQNFAEFAQQAQESKALYEKELRVEAILRAGRIPIAREDKRIAVGILGQKVAIPGTEAFFKSVETAAGAPLARHSAAAWHEAFGAPSKQIHVDLVTARARQMAMTPAIIKRDVEQLAARFEHIQPKVRKQDWKKLRDGAKLKHIDGNETYAALKGAFEDILPYFQTRIPVGEANDFLTRAEINKYLPSELRISHRIADRRMESADDFIGSIVRGYASDGSLFRRSDKALDDPYEVLWKLRVAVNQAMAFKALQHTVKKTFGVKRGYEVKSGKLHKVNNFDDTDALIDQLGKEGWVNIEEIDGGTHWYHPTIAPDILNLIKMIDPHNAGKVGSTIDAINSVWKGAVTIYNPGYWTRNTIGEIMSSWLAGVNTVTPYKRAQKMIKFGASDEAGKLDALHDQFPLLKNLEVIEKHPDGTDVLFTMKNGEKVTVQRALVAYHDQGLKSGFFNTEFKKRAAGRKFKANVISDQHHRLRNAGEMHEDWLRAAHFLDVVAKHPGTFDEAIKEGAAKVRKYHFDYSDFSHFEKVVMLRAFPFYKWTRKAAPLMLGQFFTNPGKMMVYPKAMNTVSNQLSSQDLHQDKNGFLPNFTGIAPNWLTAMFAYQTSTENDNGMINAFNLSTPQMQGVSAGLNPLSAGYSLANPFAKTGIEQLLGKTQGDSALAGGTGMSVDLNSPKYPGAHFDESDERIKQVMRNIGGPWGNYISKGIGRNAGNYENTVSPQDALSQLTGLGFYDPYLPAPPPAPSESNLSPTSPVGDDRLSKVLRRRSRR